MFISFIGILRLSETPTSNSRLARSLERSIGELGGRRVKSEEAPLGVAHLCGIEITVRSELAGRALAGRREQENYSSPLRETAPDRWRGPSRFVSRVISHHRSVT